MNITPEAPFARCGIDLCGPFPVTEDKMRYAIVLVDYLTKFVEAKAIPTASAPDTVKFFVYDVFLRHGCINQCAPIVTRMLRVLHVKSNVNN